VIPRCTGGGFVLPAIPAHLQFATALIQELNANGYELAVFFVRYTLLPRQTYPTQLRQAVEALRYLVTETNRSLAVVYLGGDSAGANLALSTLHHISRPHPKIDPLDSSAPLAGVFGLGPWINFSTDGPSFTQNANKDLLTKGALERWAKGYLAGKEPDSWSEPARAPVEWWTERILILAGSDEVLFSSIDGFAKKVQVYLPFLPSVCLCCF
jgi:acetyl esterase/lipase